MCCAQDSHLGGGGSWLVLCSPGEKTCDQVGWGWGSHRIQISVHRLSLAGMGFLSLEVGAQLLCRSDYQRSSLDETLCIPQI